MGSRRSPGASRRRTGLRILYVVTAVAWGLVFAWLLREPLFGRTIGRMIAARLSDRLGGRFSFERVEGSLLSDAVLVRLRTESPPAAPVRRLEFARARVDWRLGDLLRGRGLDALESVAIEGLDLAIDATSRTSAPDPADPAVAVRRTLDALPERVPALSAHGRVSVLIAEGGVETRSLAIEGRGDAIRIFLDEVVLPPAWGPSRPGDFEVRFTRPEAGGAIAEASGALGGVTLHRLRIEPEGGAFAWSADLEAAGGRIAVRGRGAEAAATAAGVDLALLPEWIRSRLPSDAAELREGTVDVTATVAGRETESLAVDVDLRARDVARPGLRIDNLHVAGAWTRGHGAVRVLEASGEGVRISARDAVLDPGRPWVLGDVEKLEVDVASAGDILALAGLGSLAARLPPGRTSVRLEARRSSGAGTLSLAVEARNGDAALSVRGDLAPAGRPEEWPDTGLALRVEARIPDLAGALPPGLRDPDAGGDLDLGATVGGTVRAPRIAGSVQGRNVFVRGISARSLEAEAAFEGGRLELRRLDADLPEGRLEGRDLAFDLSPPALTAGRLTATAPDLAALARWLPADGPRLEGAAEAIVDVRRIAGGAASAGIVVIASRAVVDGLDAGRLRAAGTLDWPALEIGSLEAEGPLGSIRGQARGNLRDPASWEGAATFALAIPDAGDLLRRIPGDVSVGGPLRLAGSLRKVPGRGIDAISGPLEAWADGCVVAGEPFRRIEADVEMDGQDAVVKRLLVEHASGTATASGTLNGDAGRGSARISGLAAEIGGRPFRLLAPAELHWSGGAVESGPVELGAAGGSLRASARIGDRWMLDLAGRGLDAAVLGTPARGRFDLDLQAEGTPAAPRFRLAVAAPALEAEGRTASVFLTARQEDGGLLLDDVRVRWEGLASLEGSAALPVAIAASGIVSRGAGAAKIDLRGRLAASGAWAAFGLPPGPSWSDVAFDVRGDGGSLDLAAAASDVAWQGGDVRLALEGGSRLEARIRPDGSRARLEGGTRGGVRVEARAEIGAGFDWARPPDSLERIGAAPLRAGAEIEVPDLRFLATMLGGVRRLDGSVRASLALDGTLADPRLTGEIAAERIGLRLTAEMPGFDDGMARVRLEGSTLRIEDLRANLGYAPAEVRGTIDFSGGRTPVVDLAVTGRNVLIYRDEDLRLRADLDARVTGPFDAMLAEGSGRITDALYTEPIDVTGRGKEYGRFQVFSIRDEILGRMEFDLRVTADRSFRMRNDVIQGVISGDLRLRGTGAAPEPEGTVTLEQGRVRLPFSRLAIERGGITFPAGRPFEPRLDAAARASLQGYDLLLNATGTLPDADVHVSSFPPLTSDEALVLLTTGNTPRQIDRAGMTRTALLRAGSLAGQELFANAPGEEGDLFDRLTVEIGRESTRAGQESIEAELKLTEKLHLRAERDKWQDYNLGVLWRIRFR